MKKTGTTSKRASDDARPITDADWARAKYRVSGKDVDKTEWQAAARAQLGGKQRITILVDGDVLAAFKAKAGERGYQTLINQALRQSLERETLEATLRQAHGNVSQEARRLGINRATLYNRMESLSREA